MGNKKEPGLQKYEVFPTVRMTNAKTLHLQDPKSERPLKCVSPLLTLVLSLYKGPRRIASLGCPRFRKKAGGSEA